METEFGRFGQPPVAVCDGPELAGQPELAEAGERLPARASATDR